MIQVKVDGFLSSKIYPKAGVPQGSVLSPLLFLIYINDMPDPKHHLNSESHFADDTGLWAISKKASLAANRLKRDLDALAEWCTKWRIKLDPEKTKLIMFSRSITFDQKFMYQSIPSLTTPWGPPGIRTFPLPRGSGFCPTFFARGVGVLN